MSTLAPILTEPEVVYPESDGLPLSDNTKQFRWIMTIEGGLEAQYAGDQGGAAGAGEMSHAVAMIALCWSEALTSDRHYEQAGFVRLLR